MSATVEAHIQWVPITMAQWVLRMWTEKTASRYGGQLWSTEQGVTDNL